ncbi:hypothetical protein D9M71_126060 [compost metagenome]
MLTPSAPTISWSSAPARINIPKRVWLIKSHMPTATTAPAAINSKRLTGYISPGSTSTKLAYQSGVGMAGGLRPKIRVSSSLLKNTTARVASTWSRWSRLYSLRMIEVSINKP